MSIDPQPQTGYNPAAPPQYMEKPPSSKKWWILGGCGCVTLILLCGVGIAGLFFLFARPAQQFVTESINLAETSERAVELLEGTPIVDQKNPQFSQTVENGKQKIVYSFPISSDSKSGTLLIHGTFEPPTTWIRDRMEIEIEGETFDLGDPDEAFDLDIDDGLGGDEEEME